MSETTAVETVETEPVEVEDVETEDVTDTVDAEVVSEDEDEAEDAPKRRRGRKAATQDVATPAPVEEKSSFTRTKATKLTEKIKASLEQAGELFIEAYNGRIWLAMEYESWADYLNGELGELRPRLPKPQRLELTGRLKKEAKMSQGAIADALGVDQKTVSNDLRELKGQGQDTGSTSVGTDGVSRTGAGNPGGRRKPFVDRVSSVFDRLDKAFGDLTELAADDEWEQELGAVANRHRPDVARMIGQLRAMQETFDTAPEFVEPSEETNEDE